jgi:hypothetical protein
MLIIEKIISITLFNVIYNFDKPLAYVKLFQFLAKNEWQMKQLCKKLLLHWRVRAENESGQMTESNFHLFLNLVFLFKFCNTEEKIES